MPSSPNSTHSPTPEDGELSVYLKGDLAGILTLAQNKTKPLARSAAAGTGTDVLVSQVTLRGNDTNDTC